MPDPKKAVAFSFDIGLVDQSTRPTFKANPTLAAGDFKVAKDGGALTNLTDLPTVTPASGKVVNITLTSTEMNADRVTIVAADAAGAEWDDVFISINTSAVTVDDLVRSTTPANTLDVSAAGNAGIDWNNIASPTTTVDLSGTTVGVVTALGTQAKADVNAEAVDALNVDTYAEIGQESPAATQTIRKMLGYLYKLFRNKKTQTSSTFSLFNDDAVTVDQKSAVTDDGTTATKGEVSTGP